MPEQEGIKVYLRPAGEENDSIRYAELADLAIDSANIQARKCHFIISGANQEVVVEFSKGFKCFTATAVQVVVTLDAGRSDTVRVAESIIQESLVKSQQYRFCILNKKPITLRTTQGIAHHTQRYTYLN